MRKRESYVVSLSIIASFLIVAPAFAVEPWVAYTSFDNIYDMNAPNPWVAGDWTITGTSGGAWTASGTSLDYSDTHNAEMEFGLWNAGGANPVGASTTWTYEVNARVNANGPEAGGTWPPAGLWIGIMNQADELSELVIRTDSVQLRKSDGTWATAAVAVDSNFHTIRMVRDSDGSVKVYRDQTDNQGGPILVSDTVNDNEPSYTDASVVCFGDIAFQGGADDGLDAEINYLAFDLDNAYAPEPATMILLAAGSLACILRKRR